MTAEKQNKKDSPIQADVEIIDIEEFAKAGRKPPKGRRYRFRVDRERFVTHKEHLTGREILAIAAKTPPEDWILSRRKNKAVVPVGLDDEVDLTERGVERFMTLPIDQTEGEPRREFTLPLDDEEGLTAHGYFWETIKAPTGLWVLIHGFNLLEGYSATQAIVAIQVPMNYPQGALDMAFFHPNVVRSDGKDIPQTQSSATIDGKQFQRWSRHYSPRNPWNPEEHSLLTHLVLVRHWLEREFARAA